jgi:predicted nucleotidyltransferase
MINIEDQNALFTLIAKNLKEDVACIAFGGTAMMYLQHKNQTKDIDLFFKTAKERNYFVQAITSLGYTEKKIVKQIYSKEKSSEEFAPQMFTRSDEERFDIFTHKIFQTQMNDQIIERAEQIRDFNETKRFRVKIIAPEDLVFLKAITDRTKDFEDIKTIISKTNNFSWETLIKEAKWQSEQGDGWAILDLEKKMQKLKETVFIPEKYFEMLYE